MFGPLLKVVMSKKCTPLWREAHFEVKMLKTLHVRTTFRRSDVVSRGRHNKRDKLCTQLSIFEGSLAELLVVFDVVNFKNWGRLAELLRFRCSNFENWGSLAELLPF